MKNRYANRAKISETQFRQVLKLFALDLDAGQIAHLTGFNRNTVNRYMAEIRLRISQYCRRQVTIGHPANFPCCNDPNLREHSGAPEDLLLGIVKDNGKIRSLRIPETLCRKIRESCAEKRNAAARHVDASLLIYNGMIDLRKMKYIRFAPGPKKNDKGLRSIDICEGFWGFARSRLQRFRGLRRSTLLLHIRECEFRYNHCRDEIYPLLIRICKEAPLFQ